VEVWNNNNFYLNRFLSYNSIPLIDIVDGPMQHVIDMFPYNENMSPGKINSTISMKIMLAEIWDFHIEFFDWKTNSL
jgi:hypothetical protein